MADSKWKSVFDAHPGVDQIYVVGGMPFTDRRHANNHADTVGEKMEVVRHPRFAEKKAAEEKAAAEKKAAEEKAKSSNTKGKK